MHVSWSEFVFEVREKWCDGALRHDATTFWWTQENASMLLFVTVQKHLKYICSNYRKTCCRLLISKEGKYLAISSVIRTTTNYSVGQITFMKHDTRQLCGKVMWDNNGYHCTADFILWELLSFVRRAVSDVAVSCFTAIYRNWIHSF